MQEPIYHTLEEASAALERGETVRQALDAYPIDPALVQLALDMQAKERLSEWKRQQQDDVVTTVFDEKRRTTLFLRADRETTEYLYVLETIAYRAKAYMLARGTDREPEALEDLKSAFAFVCDLT